jgi:outer membrane protein TolC
MELESLGPETQDELISPDPQSLIQYALDHRPDMLQNDYQLKQMEANVGSARAGFYPTISLSGSIEGDKAGSTEFEREDFGKTIGISLSYPLFAGGYNRAKLREAKSGMKEAQRNLESTKINVKSEVESAISGLKSAQEQLLLQRSNAELVLKARDLVEKEYAAGQVSLVRLNEAQRDLVTAQSRLALSLVSMRLAWENLRAGTAQILEASID